MYYFTVVKNSILLSMIWFLKIFVTAPPCNIKKLKPDVITDCDKCGSGSKVYQWTCAFADATATPSMLYGDVFDKLGYTFHLHLGIGSYSSEKKAYQALDYAFEKNVQQVISKIDRGICDKGLKKIQKAIDKRNKKAPG